MINHGINWDILLLDTPLHDPVIEQRKIVSQWPAMIRKSRLDCLSERIYEANLHSALSHRNWTNHCRTDRICFNFPQSDVVHTIKIITECQVFGKDGPQLQFCFKQLWCWRNPINPCPGAAQVASIIRYPKKPYFLKEPPQNHVTLKNLEMIQIWKWIHRCSSCLQVESTVGPRCK